MFSVGIIGDIHDWHTEKINFFLKKNNCNVFTLKFSELQIKFSKKNFYLYNKAIKLNLDGVWVRFIGNGTFEEITTKLTLLHLLENTKTYVHNSPRIIEKTVDKVRTSGILEINKIDSPETIVWNGKSLNKKLINKKNKYLIKPIFGSQGKKISLIRNPNQIDKINAEGNIFYLQKFLDRQENNYYSDIRVLVSNHKAISAIKRYSKKYVTNVFQGGNYKKIDLGIRLKSLSERVSRIFELGYGGIDIKEFNKKFFVLEVNGIPSWKALQKKENKDVTEILVDDFLKIMKKYKCQFK